MARLRNEIENCKVKIKDELWAGLWDTRIHDREGCEKLIKELRDLIDKFDAQREDVNAHKTFWMFGALGGSCENVPRY